VLLLDHTFRRGSGWGIPGGFLMKGEQPEDAVRRELCEETGIELDRVELAFVRTIKRPRQVEIIYRGRARCPGEALARSIEIRSLAWFAPEELPSGLTLDQRQLIARVLADGTKPFE
jgi:ADP-ribose pyrophosphatase YjhB (NUDIX family)